MERSPHKWKTMYRDQFRKFRQSPGKEVQDEANDQDDPLYDPMIIQQTQQDESIPNQIHDGTAQIKLEVSRDRAAERSSQLSEAQSKQKISDN